MSHTQPQVFLRKMRVALTPRSAILRTRLNNGALVEGYNRAGYGGRGVYIYRDSLEPELLNLQHFLGRGQIFVDVGANVGVFAMKAAKEVGDQGLVIAIEPFLAIAHRLSENVRANAFHNVRIRNFCLGGKTGEARLHLTHGKPNSFSLVAASNGESISVLSVSLDDLCVWEGLDRLDYLKIDAEGSELEILDGGRRAIGRFRPIVQVETTKVESTAGQGYRRFSALGSANNVFIPSEKATAIEAAIRLGWAEIGSS